MKIRQLSILTLVIASLSAATPPTENPLLSDFNAVMALGTLTPAHVTESAQIALASVKKRLEVLYSIPAGQRTFENTIVAYDDLTNELGKVHYVVYLMNSVHPKEEIRAECQKQLQVFNQFLTDLGLDEKLYQAVVDYSKTQEALKLNGARQRYLDEMIKAFRRNGFALSKEKRDELKVIQNKLADIGLAFGKNIADHQDALMVTEADMEGLPDDYQKSRRQEDGTYKIDLSYPSYSAFMKSSKSESARKALYVKYSNRAADKNLDVLKEMLVQRAELVRVLGYKTYAEYQLEERMAKETRNVWTFERDLAAKVREKAQRDYDELLALKRVERKDPTLRIVHPWEASYYNDQLLKTRFSLDQELVREYFDVNLVIDGLFDITQRLFGLTYRQVKDASVWNEDVRLYEVRDQGRLIGRFYLDLHPRANKYNHAACFTMVKGKETPGGYQIPVAALICNFPKATADRPGLMYHSLGSASVETFFHEFGHVLHNLLTTASWFEYSGTSVPRDFVEAPSQIFENWVWNYDVVKRFAKHYKTGEVLPKELFDKMLAARNAGSGLATLQQIYYGTLDMTLHDGYDPNGKESTTDVVKRLQNEITLYPFLEGTHWHAAFGHLNGYAAGYYGYLWSEVYAQDMFSVFERNGILDASTGKRYRDLILAPGGTRDPLDLVTEFLGRSPNSDAYMKSLGL